MGQGRAAARGRLAALACAVAMAGCGGDGGTGSAAPQASMAGSVSEAASAAPSPTPAPFATPAPSTSAAPSATPTPTPTPSEEARVVLDGGGLGIAALGDRPEDVIEALNGRYGSPVEDSDWIPAGESGFGICPGTLVRVVDYGQLAVAMSDGPTDYGAAGQRHLFAYTVAARNPDDPAAEYGDGPQTAKGIGVGSTVLDLRAAFGGGLVVREGQNDPFGSNFVVTDADGTELLYGSLTDATETGLVTTINGGQLCGE